MEERMKTWLGIFGVLYFALWTFLDVKKAGTPYYGPFRWAIVAVIDAILTTGIWGIFG